MDPGTGLTILGSAIGSAKLVEKLLGPTADYIGDGLKVWTEKRINNVTRIFAIAAKRLGTQIDNEGTVPPKVLKGILDDGSFCEDELVAEYFGGVLASSRSTVSRDDRGSSYIALLGRLSTYQVRAHYCFYHIFQNLFCDLEGTVDLTTRTAQTRLEVIIPLPLYATFMDFTDDEEPMNLLPHIVSGLTKELLISDPHGSGSGKVLMRDPRAGQTHRDKLRDYTEKYVQDMRDYEITVEQKGKTVPEVTIIPAPREPKRFGVSQQADVFDRLAFGIEPTIPGVDLFLWAHGKPNMKYAELFLLKNKFDLAANVYITPDYYKPRHNY